MNLKNMNDDIIYMCRLKRIVLQTCVMTSSNVNGCFNFSVDHMCMYFALIFKVIDPLQTSVTCLLLAKKL